MNLASQMHTTRRRRSSTALAKNGEAGFSLFLALLFVLVVSMLAAGIIFTTQTEIWTTANYRSSAQARYVAEAGAQQAANWIIHNWTPPANLTNSAQFNLNVFPAMYVGGNSATKIVFASTTMGSITDTYGSIAGGVPLDNSYKTNLHGLTSPFTPLNGNASFDVAAQLLSATQVTVSGGTQWLTKWKIVSQGSVGLIQPAKVQVVEVMSDVPTQSSASQFVPNFNYGVLATGTGCNVITAAGGSGNPGRTNAYNSSQNLGNSNPSLLGTGGSVASFGNISVTKGAYINGPVYSPDYNIGNSGQYGISCPAWTAACGNNSTGYNGASACSSPSQIWSVNEDKSGSAVGCTNGASCSNNTSNLPASLPNPTSVPTPSMPSVTPNTSPCTALGGGLCSGGNGGASCSATLPPSPSGTSYGQASFGSCSVITLQAGVYNFDTLLVSNGATINVPANGSVVINIFNSSGSSTPLTTNGGAILNPGGDPNNLTFAYAGNDTINLNNGAAMFATIYAPNAGVNISGNGGLYGAIVGHTFDFTGSGHVIYDVHLASETPHITFTGNAVTPTAHLDEFSWSSY